MSTKSKISCFTTAFLVAVVSFFVIFLFFPDFSQKYLGTSFKSSRDAVKSEKSKEKGEESESGVLNLEESGKKLSEYTDKVSDKVAEKVIDTAVETVDVKKLLEN